MKILIVQDFLRSGGTERQSVLLANAFAAARHPTTLLTFRPGGPLATTLSSAVAQRSLQPFDVGLDWFAPALQRSVRAIKPDVVLCMGRMANCYAGSIQQSSPQVSVVATMRTGKNLPKLFRRSLEAVPHIVANSGDARNTLVRDYGIGAAKITVIHNSLVFPAAGRLARNIALRAQHGATVATAVLLCVAMFRPEKNQRELIEIVDALPKGFDWQLWLAGDGPARPACVQLAADKQLAHRVKFVGFHQDPTPLYLAADVAVHASWSEALSNFLIEAQAHGLPAVAYEAQGITECFLPGVTGWAIPRNDRAAFRAALTRRMTASPDERRVLAAEAQTFARRTFEPAAQVSAYLSLFAQLRTAAGVTP